MIFKKPVIVYNYPKGIKAFYMRLNDDQKTVAAMDVLVTKVQRLLHYGTQCSFRLFTEHCLSIIIIPRFMFFFSAFVLSIKHDNGSISIGLNA